MKITIIAVGHRMPDWVTIAWDDYAKRLPNDCAIELKEIKAEPRTTGKTTAQMMAAEAKRIQAAIPPHNTVIVLDERGRDLSTKKLSTMLDDWMANQQDVTLIIGGPDGIDENFKNSISQKIRLSSLTLPHPMVRILLVEQIYRAWSILNNHPYHRE
ncbi:MAG: 23S rRNA (pseudouridine(1915)-N(3))-methyltransferase RlmH [Alcaligenaceae bacterium]|jgi:23S rRNA (pseudouridine1915-N3)-methyltransferase|nr:23S rRNA (pseudouridine(1915)-N(3))-methyltransferase RlmH [Alcaligenaceae bacterium]